MGYIMWFVDHGLLIAGLLMIGASAAYHLMLEFQRKRGDRDLVDQYLPGIAVMAGFAVVLHDLNLTYGSTMPAFGQNMLTALTYIAIIGCVMIMGKLAITARRQIKVA